MSKNNRRHNNPDIDTEMPIDEKQTDQSMVNEEIEDIPKTDDENTIESDESEILKLNEELEKQKKEYMFLMADFDNFRKRTLKEKSELIKNGGEQVLRGLLPIIDDFERGIKAAKDDSNSEAVLEGMELIYNKFIKYLNQNGVKEIDPDDKDFDTEKHEAISAVPVEDESLKGKILDTVQKGYTLNDKVLRHAKVVVGQ